MSNVVMYGACPLCLILFICLLFYSCPYTLSHPFTSLTCSTNHWPINVSFLWSCVLCIFLPDTNSIRGPVLKSSPSYPLHYTGLPSLCQPCHSWFQELIDFELVIYGEFQGRVISLKIDKFGFNLMCVHSLRNI